MKNTLLLFIYSATFLFVWAFSFFDNSKDQVTVLLGLAYSVITPFLVREKIERELTTTEKGIILSCPTFYLILFIWMHHQHGALFFLNPIWLAFIFLVLQLFWLSDIRKFSNIFIYLFIGIFYTYSFFPISDRWQPPVETTNFDDNKETQKNPSYQAPDTLSLSNYRFINSSLDTIQLRSDREYIFLETWNETCAPCIRSFRELSPFLEDLENVQSYYLYEHAKPEVRKKFDKIFSYPPVPDSSRILIDIDQQLFNAAGMQGYPYFLLFDSQGKVIFSQAGYKSFYLERMKEKILEALR